MMSTSEQRQKIGYLRRLLNLDDELYYEMLLEFDGAKSSKDLTASQANAFLNGLRDKARGMGLFKPYASSRFKQYKYNSLGLRKGMATPKQLRKIEAMWADVSRADDYKAREKALSAFIKRITGKDSINFITSRDVSKLISALETMAGAPFKYTDGKTARQGALKE